MSDAWKSAPNAAIYLPTLNQTELRFGIPTDLLARVAYQESHWRTDIVTGATRSPIGAVGLMQLMPGIFPGAGKDWRADVATAGEELARLYHHFQDWTLAVAAYNDGQGNLQAYLDGTRTLPLETQNYVAEVFADVPQSGALAPDPAQTPTRFA